MLRSVIVVLFSLRGSLSRLGSLGRGLMCLVSCLRKLVAGDVGYY